ncbi:dispanin subfamily A member 2b-like [Pristis pectinata]|uniref:dispanin subfamily A member 2b-like n=1 Tax=Pristis pectinata TaxID=685728 RepID=UPI00223D8024|nr:dispanin subfamily A member 2b-like [Pristis pectinata]
MTELLLENELASLPKSQHRPEVPSTTITLGTAALPVRDHFLWSLFNFAYCNFCCLGFLALVFSVKARDQKVLGDIYSANHYGSTSKALNLAATILSVLMFVIVFGLLVAGVINIHPK